MVFTYIYFVIISSCAVSVIAQQFGRVEYYVPENETLQTYRTNENEDSGLVTLIILTVEDPDTGIPPELTDPVTVTCVLSTMEDGWSQVTFTPQTVQQDVTLPYQVEINFSIDSSGRDNPVTCWGVSEDEQFTEQDSRTDPLGFLISKAGLVSITENSITVPLTDVITGQFIAILSEPVVTYDVLVVCRSADPNNGMQVIATNATVTDGQQSTQVAYTVNREEGSTDQLVQCYAQSLETGQQFLMSTSMGPGAIFTLQVGIVKFEPSWTEIYTTEAKMFLALDAPTEFELVFFCTAQIVNSTDMADDIIENPPCDPVIIQRAAPQPVGNETVAPPAVTQAPPTPRPQVCNNGTCTDNPEPKQWIVTQPTDGILEFSEGSSLRSVIIERNIPPSQPISERVIVTCCAPPANNPESEPYRGKSGAADIQANIIPLEAINITDTILAEDNVVETELPEPMYVELSPCSCDLTSDICDVNCCCDADCDLGYPFDCYPSFQGGHLPPTPSYDCSHHDYQAHPDWFPFMCVTWNSTAFLGYFYEQQSISVGVTEYDNLLDDANTPITDFSESEPRVVEEPHDSYKQGTSIKTGAAAIVPPEPLEDLRLKTGTNLRLTLPTSSHTGGCIESAPVRFLTDRSHTCLWKLNKDLCESSTSTLNARMYAGAYDQSHPAYPRPQYVLEENEGQQNALRNLYTHYRCDPNVDKYIGKMPVTTSSQSSFTGTTPEDFDDCDYETTPGVFMCPNQSAPPDTTSDLPYCSFDDGFSLPMTPSYDEATNICHDAVASVSYDFIWEGNFIISLHATIILADLPMARTETITRTIDSAVYQTMDNVTTRVVTPYDHTTTTTVPTILTQTFNVKWNHVGNATVGDGTVYERSGYPGYEFGSRVFSGVFTTIQNNSTRAEPDLETSSNATTATPDESEAEIVDASLLHQLAVWKTGYSNLCSDAGRLGLTFGDDLASSCLVKLSYDDLLNCTTLRMWTLSQLDELMLSTVISGVGDPVFENDEQSWIQILRDDLSTVLYGNLSDMTTVAPEDTTIDVTTEGTTVANNETTTTNTNDAQQAYDFEADLLGRCHSVPSGIHITVMYTKTGASNWKPIYRIMGAKIEHSLSTWRLRCSLSNACITDDGTIPDVESFTLYSSAQFVEIPEDIPTVMSKYDDEHYDPLSICRYDSCWGEVTYPFMSQNPSDSFMYSLGIGLSSIIFIIGLVSISKPWW